MSEQEKLEPQVNLSDAERDQFRREWFARYRGSADARQQRAAEIVAEKTEENS